MKSFIKMCLAQFLLFLCIHGVYARNSFDEKAEAAERLKALSSNYETEAPYEGEDKYIGFGDDHVDFGGPNLSFFTEMQGMREFQFQISNVINPYVVGGNTVNPTGATKTVCLHRAYFNTAIPIVTLIPPVAPATVPTLIGGPGANNKPAIRYCDGTELNAAGVICDCVLTDGPTTNDPILAYTDGGNLNCYITAQGLTYRIEDFLNFAKHNPCRIPQITIQASNISAYEKTLTIKQMSPFKDLGSTPLHLTNFFQVTQYQPNKIIVTTPKLQLDNQTVMLMDIDPGITVIITYKIGAIHNASHALNSKHTRANKNISKWKMRTTSNTGK
jgi:hypothetical protein